MPLNLTHLLDEKAESGTDERSIEPGLTNTGRQDDFAHFLSNSAAKRTHGAHEPFRKRAQVSGELFAVHTRLRCYQDTHMLIFRQTALLWPIV